MYVYISSYPEPLLHKPDLENYIMSDIDGRITVPKTIAVEAIKLEALFFGLPAHAIIEGPQSVDDYATSLQDSVLRLKRLKLNLAELSKRNFDNGVAISNEAFVIWVVHQILDRMSLSKGIPSEIQLPLSQYKKINAQFMINDSQINTLLITMREIFSFIGNEPNLNFSTSMELKSPPPVGPGCNLKYNLDSFILILKFSRD